MATSGSWGDFEGIRTSIRTLTVEKLKAVIQGLNDECYTTISKSGKKQDLIDRIMSNLEAFRANNMEDRWSKAKGVINQIREGASFARSYSYNTPSSTYPPAAPTVKYAPAPPTKLNYTQSRPSMSTAAAGPASRGLKPTFKESPFFRVDQAVSAVAECPESSSSTDRRQSSVAFTLNPEQQEKLKNPRYQLRLFCTSSTFFSLSPAFRSTSGSCLVEFPPTCEVRVNSVQLTASLKGLKKKPGTAPPPDLGKYIRVSGATNRVEMVYVNSQQQPIQAKKYYLIVMLVETTKIEELVSRLQTSCRVNAQEILAEIKSSVDEDEDIVSGPQKMSLKCPLSFMRVKLPCRSSKCVHRQCFDATSWYAVNEQTTTWLCPVCERQLEDKDLIIDGYFEEILENTDEEVDDVMIEADGEWHTQDNLYGSAIWKAAHPPIAPPPVAKAPSPARTNGKGKEKAEDVEIFVLDSDDEDENQVKRELSTSFGGRSASIATTTTRKSQETVIDLTLDSDDESPQPPRPQPPAKRTADTAGFASAEGGSKRGRTDSAQYVPMPPGRVRALSPSRQLPLPHLPGSGYRLPRGPASLDYSMHNHRTW